MGRVLACLHSSTKTFPLFWYRSPHMKAKKDNAMLIQSMRTLRVVIAGVVTAGTLLIGLSGCARRETIAPALQQTQPVVVGYLPIYVDLPLFVAKERGFFKRHHVDIRLQRFEQSPDIGTALLTGNIDVGASMATAVMLSIESRDPGKLKIFLVDAENRNGYLSSFVVLKQSGITDLLGLRGKTIGSFPGPAADTFGKLVLQKAGLDPAKDVRWVDLASSTHLSALSAKTVDALFTYEPIATQAVLEKDAVKLLPGAVEQTVIEPWQAGVWVMSQRLLVKDPTTAKAFILAIYDALEYMRAHPEEAKQALTQYTSISPSVAAATPNIPFTKIGEVDVAALQKHEEILRSAGVLSKRIEVSPLLLSADAVRNTK